MILIKYIGIAILIIGLILLALVIIRGRQSGVRAAAEELEMILGSGYVTMHTASKQTRSVLDKTPVKVPPRKRALSREAAEILKKVEEERQAEKEVIKQRPSKKYPEKVKKKEGTAILEAKPKPAKKGTEVLPQKKQTSGYTGTDVLTPEKKRQSDTSRTDILTPQKRDTLPKGTDILPSPKKRVPPRSDILTLQDKSIPATQKESPVGRKGTAVLEAAKQQKSSEGTAVLDAPTEKKNTDVLRPERKGTDVLKTKEENHEGTAVLDADTSAGIGPKISKAPKQKKMHYKEQPAEKRNETAVLNHEKPDRSGTAVLPEADSKSRTGILIQDQNTKKQRTAVLEQKSGTAVLEQKGTDVLEQKDRRATAVLTQKED